MAGTPKAPTFASKALAYVKAFAKSHTGTLIAFAVGNVLGVIFHI